MSYCSGCGSQNIEGEAQADWLQRVTSPLIAGNARIDSEAALLVEKIEKAKANVPADEVEAKAVAVNIAKLELNLAELLASKTRFCAECGRPIVADSKAGATNFDVKNLFQNKAVRFGGIGVLVAVLVVVLVLVLSPFTLDAKTAQAKLMTTDDFDFSAAFANKQVSAVDSSAPVYRASDKCVEDVEMQSMITDQGKLLASVDFKENSPKTTSVYFDEDIIEFKDDATASKFVSLAKAGYDDANCEYTSSTEYVSTVGVLSDASDAQTKLGVGGSNSFYLRYQSDMTVTGYYNFTISNDSRIAVIARGKYVGIFRGTIDAETKSVSPEEMESSLKVAISKMFG